MGYVPVEQTVAIIEATKNKPNYWWLLIIGVVPVVLGWWLRRKKSSDFKHDWRRPTHNLD